MFKKIRVETFLTKYGVKSPLEIKECLDSYRRTSLKNHGVEYPMQKEDIRKKSLNTCIQKYGCIPWHTERAKLNAYQARLGFSREEYLESLPEYMAYRNEVRKITENQPLHELEFSDKRRSRHEYHLDHVYSIRQGFLDHIPPEIIGHIANLRFIPAKTNIKKGASCDITKQELLKNYDQRVSKKN